MTAITLYGELGEKVGKSWNLDVSSVSEALHAIETIGGGKLFKFLSRQDQRMAKYRVLINGEDFVSTEKLDSLDKVEKVSESNLVLKQDLKTVEIVPVLEGQNNILNIVLGVLLIFTAFAIAGFSFGALSPVSVGLIVIGIGLIASGIMGMLSRPPEFEDFRDIGKGGKLSYLFNGPSNVVKEGGPMPVGYGRLLVGSQVISAAYNVYDVSAEVGSTTTEVTSRGGPASSSGGGGLVIVEQQ